MAILADTIAKFDIVAILKIRDSTGTAIEALEREVDALGTESALNEDYPWLKQNKTTGLFFLTLLIERN